MQEYSILDHIKSPAVLRRLSYAQLRQLCAEIRHCLVHNVSRTGGHLASNLGVVELTVALHRVFRTPVDSILWDVGHQCYVHKLLTGRRNAFSTLRQEDGLSGFPDPQESRHDAFVAGHASTSIALADGIARATRLRGQKGHAVAVIGDGALTGGVAYEGLNNAARGENSNLIIVLNDNKMSISKNASSIGRYLARLRNNRSYFLAKDTAKSVLQTIPVVGQDIVEMISNSKSQLKDMFYNSSLFEELGLVYMGPVDGHDLPRLCDVFMRAKSLGKPVLIHVETVKGKGYRFAEQNPGHYHGVSKFDPKVGSRIQPGDNFSEAFGRYLTRLAKDDPRICALTAAMKYGTGLNYFKDAFGDTGRFVDVGIAEQHAVAFSAAMASRGMLPVCAIYSSFLQRAYDQIVHECSLIPQHVVLAVDRAGLVGEDGKTHEGIFDCAFLSSVPGMVIYSPATYVELRRCLRRALYEETGVVAVRYPRGAQPVIAGQYAQRHENFLHLPGEGLLIVTYGREWAEVAKAAEQLRENGWRPGLLKLTRVFPFDEEMLALAMAYPQVLFVEEGVKTGGIGGHFLAALMERGYRGAGRIQALQAWIAHAPPARQLCLAGLDAASVAAQAETLLTGEVGR